MHVLRAHVRDIASAEAMIRATFVASLLQLFDFAACRLPCLSNPNQYIEMPPTKRTLADVPGVKPAFRKSGAAPKAEPAIEKQLFIATPDSTGIERNPLTLCEQRAPNTDSSRSGRSRSQALIALAIKDHRHCAKIRAYEICSARQKREPIRGDTDWHMSPHPISYFIKERRLQAVLFASFLEYMTHTHHYAGARTGRAVQRAVNR